MVTIKEIFESGNWNITRVIRGCSKVVRIDAKTRNRIADGDNGFSKWVSLGYANRLCVDNYGKKVTDLNSYSY
tara:strand:- start:345 stop:563 length:219 start_codon:yes stop_codon:yes gene_type:complete